MILKKKKLVYIDVTGGKRVEKEKWFESNSGNFHYEIGKLIEQFRYDTGCEIVRIEYEDTDTYNEARED